jgi:MoaA/NifB/PqqE/SkfB family radical SAM enzyme
VVIWNLIRRCNLTCKHCYSISADKDFAGELGTDEVFRVMDELKAFRVPVLILSGASRCCGPTSSRSPGGPRRWASTSACRPTAR